MSKHLISIGGSDAGISAALRARELDPDTTVDVIVADAYPNFSICGIPYYVSGEVTHWRNLAHRTAEDLAATGMQVRTDTRVSAINAADHCLTITTSQGTTEQLDYDAVIIGTGARSTTPAITGLTGPHALGPADGVHLLHSMGDTFELMTTLEQRRPHNAVIIGAGYIGLEMAEALTTRGIAVTQIEALPEVLPTVDLELGALVHTELERAGVEVLTSTTVSALTRTDGGAVAVTATGGDGQPVARTADLVLVVVGVTPDTDLAVSAGVRCGVKGAIEVDEQMHTNLTDVYAAGDCVITHHRLLGPTWLPLGTTAHKQGRVAGENAIGGHARFAGSLGTQVVKVFDLVAARTGLREHDITSSTGWQPLSHTVTADDHKAYYPGATPITLRITGDRGTGRLLGAQLIGRRGAEIAKRVDTFATALFHEMTVDAVSDLDLSYTPPLGSPWDAVQVATQAWTRAHQQQLHTV